MVNKAKTASLEDGKAFLQRAFRDVQRVLETQLTLSTGSITHDGIMGAVNEEHWIDVFRAYLPNRYAVNSGIIIDSEGRTSEQIDIVIHDPQYTPTLLTQKDHRYIPAEAVYAVVEAKPEVNKGYLEYAGAKAASVRQLSRTSVAIPHAGGAYLPKPDFDIIAGIVAAKAAWSDGLGRIFEENLEALTGHHRLDFGCALADGAFDRFDEVGSLTIVPAEGALIFSLFRLLGKLQSLGTVPAINWVAYSEILR